MGGGLGFFYTWMMEEMCLALMPSARVGVCKLGAWGVRLWGMGGGMCCWADNVWGWCLHGGEVGAGYWRARAYWEAPAGPVA